MKMKNPGVLQIIRAPFFSSILAPLFAGTLLSVIDAGSFNPYGFSLVVMMGLGLHAATNVYNDIYDTLQGTDRVNEHRNDFSGGSGVLVRQPELLKKMYWVARIALILAFVATLALMLVVERKYWSLIWILYFLSVFFSKYYTAAPVKLAYRGLGEIFVWLAFGPMAVGVAAVSQNAPWAPLVLYGMPITGLSTLSILWIGQMIDLQADSATGKRGLVSRLGTMRSRWGFAVIHLLIIANVLWLAHSIENRGWLALISLLPYLLFWPKTWRILFVYHDQPKELAKAAGLNVQIHLIFSFLLVLSLLGIVLF